MRPRFYTTIKFNYSNFLFCNGLAWNVNYPYSKDVKSLHNREPDLNVYMRCFSLVMVTDGLNSKKIINLTELKNANKTVSFITGNTNLKFN